MAIVMRTQRTQPCLIGYVRQCPVHRIFRPSASAPTCLNGFDITPHTERSAHSLFPTTIVLVLSVTYLHVSPSETSRTQAVVARCVSMPTSSNVIYPWSTLLDAGGIRGLSALILLHDIMKMIQYQQQLDETPLPCDYFDPICGTGTGGCVTTVFTGQIGTKDRKSYWLTVCTHTRACGPSKTIRDKRSAMF